MIRPMLGAVIAATLALSTEARAPLEAPLGPEAETLRIQAHLERVARSLRADTPDHLTPAQRAARETALNWLDEYRAAGVFPHNHVHPDGPVPVFVDPHGTPCAVGYLMLRSGAHDLVEEIVRTNNLVRVPELEGDPRMAAWLETYGLSLDDAARIQPAYNPPPGELPTVRAGYADGITVGLSVATAAVVSYMAMAGKDTGRPWADVLAAGTALSHTALLVGVGTNDVDDPGWMVGLNVLGALVGAGAVALRASSGDAADDGGGTSPVQAFVEPGAHGTRIGLSIRP